MPEVSTYVRAVREHWLSAVLTWLSGAFLYVGGDVLSASHWPRWLLLVILLAGLMVAQFRTWRDEHRDRVALQDKLDAAVAAPRPEAHSGHVDDLRFVAQSIDRAIRNGTVAGNSDPRTRSLLAHLPALEAPLVEWDAAVRSVLEAHHAFRKHIERELTEAGMDEAPYVREHLEPVILDEALRVARHDPALEVTLTTASHGSNDERWSVFLGGTDKVVVHDVATMAGCDAHVARINALFRACYSSPQALAIPVAEERKAKLQASLPPVFGEVEHSFTPAILKINPNCGLCGCGQA